MEVLMESTTRMGAYIGKSCIDPKTGKLREQSDLTLIEVDGKQVYVATLWKNGKLHSYGPDYPAASFEDGHMEFFWEGYPHSFTLLDKSLYPAIFSKGYSVKEYWKDKTPIPEPTIQKDSKSAS